MDVVVLAGGLSHERDVSLRSGRRVAEALREVGIPAEVADVDAQLIGSLHERRPDVVLPMLHGAAGEDGSIRDVLELLGLPYVGARADACRVAFDKPVAKAVVAASGVAVADAVALPAEVFRELGAGVLLGAVEKRLGLPLVVKPTRGGSSLGMSVVRQAEELPAAMVAAYAYGDTALIERFVSGTEVAVSVVAEGGGLRVLPAVEILPDSGVYDYAARYTAGTTQFFAPARLGSDVAAAVETAALSAHQALHLRDLSRIDLIVDGGVPYFLEANVAPGMTETSLFPQAVAAAELGFGSVLAELVTAAADRHP